MKEFPEKKTVRLASSQNFPTSFFFAISSANRCTWCQNSSQANIVGCVFFWSFSFFFSAVSFQLARMHICVAQHKHTGAADPQSEGRRLRRSHGRVPQAPELSSLLCKCRPGLHHNSCNEKQRRRQRAVKLRAQPRLPSPTSPPHTPPSG